MAVHYATHRLLTLPASLQANAVYYTQTAKPNELLITVTDAIAQVAYQSLSEDSILDIIGKINDRIVVETMVVANMAQLDEDTPHYLSDKVVLCLDISTAAIGLPGDEAYVPANDKTGAGTFYWDYANQSYKYMGSTTPNLPLPWEDIEGRPTADIADITEVIRDHADVLSLLTKEDGRLFYNGNDLTDDGWKTDDWEYSSVIPTTVWGVYVPSGSNYLITGKITEGTVVAAALTATIEVNGNTYPVTIDESLNVSATIPDTEGLENNTSTIHVYDDTLTEVATATLTSTYTTEYEVAGNREYEAAGT